MPTPLFGLFHEHGLFQCSVVQRTSDKALKTAEPRIFVTTQWTNILLAGKESGNALETLCATYRPALLAWLRSRGEKPDEVEDLVQGFFEHLLRKDFLGGVAREKGRFRTFLLTAFQHFLIDEHRRRHSGKRGGGKVTASLDETDEEGELIRNPAVNADAPDLAFDRAWARALLGQALRTLEGECARNGHAALCLALEPALFSDENAPAYGEIAIALGMTEAAVKMAALRLRQRLKRLIRDEVLDTVTDEQELEDELGYLKSLFAKA